MTLLLVTDLSQFALMTCSGDGCGNAIQFKSSKFSIATLTSEMTKAYEWNDANGSLTLVTPRAIQRIFTPQPELIHIYRPKKNGRLRERQHVEQNLYLCRAKSAY